MRVLDRRLTRLEARLHTGGHGCAVSLRMGETFNEAAKRLKVMHGGYIVVGEVLPADVWSALARRQQAELVSEGQAC